MHIQLFRDVVGVLLAVLSSCRRNLHLQTHPLHRLSLLHTEEQGSHEHTHVLNIDNLYTFEGCKAHPSDHLSAYTGSAS